MFDRHTLYYGDNLEFISDPHVFPDESVDLIYLDPPFNSNASYNVLFREVSGDPSAAQIRAFDDTWTWDQAANAALHVLMHDRHTPGELSALIRTFHQFLGHSPMLAYLVQMAVRLVHLRRVLKPTGSLYLHCDPTASHYLKLVLDAVFGAPYFRAEIVWRRTNAKGLAFTGYPKNHDIIFYYSKDTTPKWNRPYKDYNPDYIEGFYKHIEQDTGRRYQLGDLTNPNRNRPNLTYEWKGVKRVWRWTKERMAEADAKGLLQYSSTGLPRLKRYLDEAKGHPVDTIWDDIRPIQAHAAERLGYPTQKPLELLKRIVTASSNPGDVVLDPFCGCGTTIDAVETLNRENPGEPPRVWLGIDITHLAVNLIKARIARFDPPAVYDVVGEPVDLTGARALFEEDAYQFQFWACGLVGARPAGAAAGSKKGKKGADRGIDGVRYFADDKAGPKAILVQVKGGRVGAGDVRDFRGTIEREQAAVGLFITLAEPTAPMVKEAAAAGMYESRGVAVPRVQIVTIETLLTGGSPRQPAGVQLPAGALDAAGDRTVQRAKPHDAGGLFQRAGE